MPLLPNRFLFRLAHCCLYQKGIPVKDDPALFDLPEACQLNDFGALDGRRSFADLRLGWNELGLAVQLAVCGKDRPPEGSASRLRGSDGLVLWIDTRDARTSHRGTRTCHQFHFLPTGGGSDGDEPVFSQAKINRALQDAPLCAATDVAFHCASARSGYVLRAFLPASVLNGFDPEQTSRLGVFYAVRDAELGDQTLSMDADFPYWEDPSLWGALELVR
jgi:hypothetical protein